MKKLLFITVFVFMLAISCSSPAEPGSDTGSGGGKVTPSPDARFTGEWHGSKGKRLEFLDGWEWYTYYNLEFKSDNVMEYYVKREDYRFTKPGYPIRLTYEWKLENSTYYRKLHDNELSDWDVFDIEYIDSENIKFNGLELSRVEE